MFIATKYHAVNSQRLIQQVAMTARNQRFHSEIVKLAAMHILCTNQYNSTWQCDASYVRLGALHRYIDALNDDNCPAALQPVSCLIYSFHLAFKTIKPLSGVTAHLTNMQLHEN